MRPGRLQKLIYRWGFKPTPNTILGSLFFSPSLALEYSVREAMKNLSWADCTFYDSNWRPLLMNPCKAPGCGKVDDEKPMCFTRTDWCSERHRKIIMGELPAEEE